jgi:hypothetical protein
MRFHLEQIDRLLTGSLSILNDPLLVLVFSQGYDLVVVWSVVRPVCIRLWFDRIRPHHLVILVVHDVAVPGATVL